ncbi:beta-ketoacyl-ACP synthase III [Chondromyces crocatus]|uniref:Beta-ketoacyl-[acyl-carrier-protein] synthase III n=1 Tax=Chondromyces crocatus TaxID=52 RepID=A0A0K1EMB4_CHOCO|nr:beta-ketoacyl-ACP synthase III [Chondromyces crocatus]AKT41792.1 3-oxoacyl-ACP synthase [Chondromyces crocatus]
MARQMSIPRTRIVGTGHYLPATIVDNDALAKRLDTTDAWIQEHTGIQRRRVAAPGEVTSDMAAAASRAALEAAGLTPADLDMIIVATTSGDSPMPATAVHVQQKIGADMIPSFDIAASFAGFLYAMTVADQFISAGTFNTILVVGADMMTRLVNPEDRTTVPLFGDGAGAVVLGPATGDNRGILSTRIHADGGLTGLMSVPAGGSAEPVTADALAGQRHRLQIKGRELFQISVKHLTSYSMQALKAAGLTSAELDWVIPHQANRNIVDLISARLGYPRHKFIEDLAETGNTGAASIPIALDGAVRDGRVQPGHAVLLCALGAGITWGAAMVRM